MSCARNGLPKRSETGSAACIGIFCGPERFRKYQVELSIDTDTERYYYDQENRDSLIDRCDVVFSRV